MKKQVIRVGDWVKVVNSKFVRRTGYSLVWYDLLDEVTNDVRTWRAWKELTGHPIPLKFAGDLPQEEEHKALPWLWEPPELPKEFLKAVAMERVRERGFGGSERALHYCEPPVEGKPLYGYDPDRPPDCTGAVYPVDDKKVVKTGRRWAPGCYGEDYWSGGLHNMQTHVLLLAGPGWLEERNVELVRRAPKPSITVKEKL